MENNNLPKMTDEQRKAALERSAEARRERMEFKGVVKTGEISLADACRVSVADSARESSSLSRS